ncbi:hypothetical protein VTP01DRAFT_9870 [Rhizomucor pusillus]|uniref:uncharacterized protein n=1 Tax=Rhizomucor pusillus TaxID=4840 RepID=UPI003743E5C8
MRFNCLILSKRGSQCCWGGGRGEGGGGLCTAEEASQFVQSYYSSSKHKPQTLCCLNAFPTIKKKTSNM